MKQPLLTAVAVCALSAAAACSSSDARAPSPRGTSAPAPRASHAGYAFPTQDAPYESILAEARRSGRPALLFFWTSWWGWCRRLDDQTLRDPRVGSEVARFISVRYDGDSAVGKSVAQQFGVRGYPSVVVVDGSGRKLDEFAGFRTADQFIQRLRANAPR